jgi:L,D-peptidoglycan transpeptidase YkuD (ErfK/YbiS/YcfS/YnhG family)
MRSVVKPASSGTAKIGTRPVGLSHLEIKRIARPGPNGVALGRLHAGPVAIVCAIGAGGIRQDKREGDLATPAGQFRLLEGFYRPAAVGRLKTRLRLRQLNPHDGWCDDPAAPTYNRRITLPDRHRHEALWRADGLYDLVFVLDYNIAPRRKNRGSAIFLHCAGPDLSPTAGCVALRLADLRRLLPRLSRKIRLVIG